MTESEEWRPIVGYEGRYKGRYEVSSLGRVRSLRHRGRARRKPLILKPQRAKKRQQTLYALADENRRTRRRIAGRLVLLAFVGPPDRDQECSHLDDNNSNNRLDNLRWETHRQNVRRCWKGTSRAFPPPDPRFTSTSGASNHQAKLTAEIVRDARLRFKDEGNISQRARELGVHAETLRHAIIGRTWRHI